MRRILPRVTLFVLCSSLLIGAGTGCLRGLFTTIEGNELTMVNNSANDLCGIYISATDATTWGSNLLGNDTIPVGESDSFFKEPGIYDVRGESCAGGSAEAYGVDLNEDVTLYYTGGGVSLEQGGDFHEGIDRRATD